MTEIPNGKLVYTSKPQFSKLSTKTLQVERGCLTGSTDTDYFYFLCPKCGKILQHNVLELWELPSNNPKVKNTPCQHVVYEVWCQSCKLGANVKVSNLGWQGGKIEDSPTYSRKTE
ncbi:hypothetical protein ACFLV2_03875 [Chloroflexota bacterium]